MLIFIPAQPTYIEAETYVVSGYLVDQPKQYEKITEPSDTEACNCVTFVRNRVAGLDRMVAILPNTVPKPGTVAIEFFKDIKHISIVTKVELGGVWVEEANYVHCETGKRFIPFNKYSLVGFHQP